MLESVRVWRQIPRPTFAHSNVSRHSFTPETETRKGIVMLYTFAIVLIILWLLGFVSSYTMGGFIHVLLVIAIVMVLVRIITGKKPL
jgi:hypothetical protein